MSSIAARHARRVEARRLALELLTRHGLADWGFAFNRRKRSLGLCLYAARRIELSIHLVEKNGPEEIRDTILHEIAHALVGPEHGHDAFWKRKCLEIGARPQRCSEADMPLGKWRAHCGGCGASFHRYRRPRGSGWFCRDCGPERGSLTWRAEGTG